MIGWVAAHFLDPTFPDAPLEARFWAAFALTTGLLGFGAAVVATLAFHLGGRYAEQSSATWLAGPHWTPLSIALRHVVGPRGIASGGLTPDAAAETFLGPWRDLVQTAQGILRFFSYVPLLLGLSGTILGLSRLLPEVRAAMGAAFERSAPTARSDQTRVPRPDDQDAGARASAAMRQLQGVFVGTIGGIWGSLAATVGGLLFFFTSAQSTRSVERYVHVTLLPALPKAAISVRLEEEVLASIGHRLRPLVLQIDQAFTPLVEKLTAHATESANAAKLASEAFAEAAEAARHAKSLGTAARHLASAVSTIDGASESLSAAAGETKKAVDSQSRLAMQCHATAQALYTAGQSLQADVGALTVRLADEQASFKGLVGASEERLVQVHTALAGTAAGTAERVGALQGAIASMQEAFAGLAKSVEARNTLEGETLADARAQTEAFGKTLALVGGGVSTLAQERAAVREQLEGFGARSVATISADLRQRIDELVGALLSTLETVQRPLETAVVRMRSETSDFEARAHSAREALPAIRQSLDDMTVLLQRFTAPTSELASALRQLAEMGIAKPKGEEPGPKQSPPVAAPQPAEPHMRQLLKELQELNSLLRSDRRKRWWRFS